MDNGQNFRSTEFLQFLETNRITPKFTAPYHPATNGQAERFVQTLKNALKKIFADPRNRNVTLSDALCNFLMQYRITPHCITGIAPSERMFKKQMRTHLTLSLPNKPKTITSVNTNKKFREFAVGETVRCRNYSGKIKWKRGRIAQRIGKLHYRVALEDGRSWEQQVDQILRSKEYWDHLEDPQEQVDMEGPDEPRAPYSEAGSHNEAQVLPEPWENLAHLQ